MQRKTTATLLLAGLLAGGAWAQTAAPTSDIPVNAGEASTMTQGRPNLVTNNPAPATGVMGASSAPVTSSTGVPVGTATMHPPVVVVPVVEGRIVPLYHATVTSNIPTKAGEASTMTNGVPNMVTQNAVTDGQRLVVPPQLEVQRVPHQAGEATTMVGGRPNANPNDVQYKQ